MPPSSSKPVALSTSAARRIWLRAQRLDEIAPFGGGAEATRKAVEHLGYVQIDTINVIERCHHHILYTRIPGYRREHLAQAQTRDKTVFEYWTHALSYVPVRDMRFYTGAMKREWQRRSAWFGSVTRGDLQKVLGRIRRDGALTIRDIDDDVLVEKDHDWASRKPSKRALQLAFYRGIVTVSRRLGMLKTYELTDRHFGWDRPPRPATDRELREHLLDRALRAQGIVSLESACHLEARHKKAMLDLIEKRVRCGELAPIALQGAGKSAHWARPETIEEAGGMTTGEPVHILSPFDPLVHRRKRLELFFGYAHRFEAYLPRNKRVFGYFALPVLVGDRIAAVLDLKTDREAGKLLVRQWTWTGKGGRRADKARIEEALHRFEQFQLGR